MYLEVQPGNISNAAMVMVKLMAMMKLVVMIKLTTMNKLVIKLIMNTTYLIYYYVTAN